LDSLANRVQSASRRLRHSNGAAAANPEWALRRGEQRYSGTFDVIGNFPGYEDFAGLIVNAEVTVTSQFLIIDEGTAHGFALGIGWLIDVSADGDPETFGDVLIRYRSDDANVLFRIRPTRARLPLRGGGKPEQLVAALSDAGADQADLARDVASALRLSWDSLQSLESESVVWGGHATAPLRPGLECTPASVWVTPTALIWGSPRGSGVNRLPITTINRLAAFTLADETASPTVYVRTRVISDIRLDLPFIFNVGAIRDGITERAAFLALFRPDAVIEGTVSQRPQPWLDESPAPPGDTDDPDETPQTDETDQVSDDGGESADDMPLFETWANVSRPTTFPYVPPGEGQGITRRLDGASADDGDGSFNSSDTRLVDAISAWPGANTPSTEPEQNATPVVTQPDAIPTYLAVAQRAITEVNDAIDRRIAGNAAPLLRATPPSSDDQARALAELIELTSTDYYSPEQARTMKARITRIGEAAVRLRSLIELCNAGHMTIGEVGAKRDTIMANLPAATDDE
ncbi:MAG TPA: hypothetical protein VFS91_02435, partial [Nitrobacter sp.]|nr:hypothetical protein [Nitrobacter sp.]